MLRMLEQLAARTSKITCNIGLLAILRQLQLDEWSVSGAHCAVGKYR